MTETPFQMYILKDSFGERVMVDDGQPFQLSTLVNHSIDGGMLLSHIAVILLFGDMFLIGRGDTLEHPETSLSGPTF